MVGKSYIVSLNICNHQAVELAKAVSSEFGGSPSIVLPGIGEGDFKRNIEHFNNNGFFFSSFVIAIESGFLVKIEGGKYLDEKNQHMHDSGRMLVTIEVPNNSSGLSVDRVCKVGNFVSHKLMDFGSVPLPSMLKSEEGVTSGAILTAFNNAGSAALEKISQNGSELWKKLMEREEELNRRFDEKMTSLEEKRKDLEMEYNNKYRNLKEKEISLDDRENTHVRRSTARELMDFLRDNIINFETTKEMKVLRWPIHLVFIAMMVISGAISVISAYGLSSLGQSGATMISVYAIVKSAFSSLAFLTTSALYITWMNRWFDRHSETQFNAKQYQIDINRATWVVEAALEWRKNTADPMPQVLVEGITRNLFNGPKVMDSDKAPLDMLASTILGSAAQVKLNVNGTQVEIDKKGLEKMKNS